MASTSGNEIQNMALFCDFENVALGVRDAKYAEFDIRKVLERLLVKGDIVVKKAYCDWERYKDFKRSMHEAAFELIEIPHVRQSGKNSADIRMVVDALDLCYTKAHVDAFVIISGDSDFSPLVSKLRENNKIVIGVGVRSSTSDLLVGNCDEFIFYDDLVKAEEARKKASAKKVGEANAKKQQAKRSPDKKASADEPSVQDATDDARSLEAIELVVDTVEALMSEKDLDAVHASNVKLALKRRR
ncbi:MAG: NYN domain-containing protein, partial [Burkholderiales bacterium]